MSRWLDFFYSLANYERTRIYLFSVESDLMDTIPSCSKTDKNLHLPSSYVLNELGFLISYEQRHKIICKDIIQWILGNVCKTFSCSSFDGKVVQPQNENIRNYLHSNISIKLQYMGKGLLNRNFQVFSYPWSYGS